MKAYDSDSLEKAYCLLHENLSSTEQGSQAFQHMAESMAEYVGLAARNTAAEKHSDQAAQQYDKVKQAYDAAKHVLEEKDAADTSVLIDDREFIEELAALVVMQVMAQRKR